MKIRLFVLGMFLFSYSFTVNAFRLPLKPAASEILESAVRPVVAGTAGNPALFKQGMKKWIVAILDNGPEALFDAAPDMVKNFSFDDAMDIYINRLAKSDYFKNMDNGLVDGEKWVKTQYSRVLQDVKGTNSSGISSQVSIKFPKEDDADGYVKKLKEQGFDENVQVNLPKSLKRTGQADVTGDSIDFQELFSKCKK